MHTAFQSLLVSQPSHAKFTLKSSRINPNSLTSHNNFFSHQKRVSPRARSGSPSSSEKIYFARLDVKAPSSPTSETTNKASVATLQKSDVTAKMAITNNLNVQQVLNKQVTVTKFIQQVVPIKPSPGLDMTEALTIPGITSTMANLTTISKDQNQNQNQNQALTPLRTGTTSDTDQVNVAIPVETHSRQQDIPSRIGSVLGATALVVGTTVGAGILALPTVTIQPGFIPSTAALFGAWLYMLTLALLIAEATVNTMLATGRSDISIPSMIELTLGKKGALVAGSAYGFLHYSMLVAYMAQGGHVIGDILKGLGVVVRSSSLPSDVLGTTLFTSIMASLLYFGPRNFVESVNNLLVVGLVTSFLSFVYYSGSGFDPSNLLSSNLAAIPAAFPIMALALVFHNVVPIVVAQLEGDLKKIRTALMAGSFIPFLMFSIWNAVILGTVPAQVAASIPNFDPIEYIRHTASPSLSMSVSTFTLLAVATSFVGFLYSLADFFTDILQSSGLVKVNHNYKPLTFALSMAPPLAIAVTNPDIFFSALNYSGTFGTMILYGIIPAAMVWKIRYDKPEKKQVTPTVPEFIPGNKPALIGVASVATGIMLHEIVEKLSCFF